MEYFFTEEQIELRNLAREIAQKSILPVRAELDEKEEFPWDLMKIFADAGFFSVFIPEAYEGLGGGCMDLCIVVEEISKVCSGVAVSYAATALGCYPILLFGSEEQKKKYLPDIAAGRKLTAFAITEAEAGSDAGATKTTAVKKNEGYVLNGTKQWLTNGGEAEIYTVIAMTNP
ncbi:acyl-CoA dehydrogenase family protein, partial [bacterium]|nr:acyl-CoA dehydrogenase family protein [bacterium]